MKLTRIRRCFTSALLALAAGGYVSPGLAQTAAPLARSNIVFIFADDGGWGDLSSHGHESLPADYQGDGENLLPALQCKAINRTRAILWEWRGPKPEPAWWPHLAVRDGDWKLLLTADAQRRELHNLKSDRAEDAAKDQSKVHPEIAARLTGLALDWKATLPDQPNPAWQTRLPNEDASRSRPGADEAKSK